MSSKTLLFKVIALVLSFSILLAVTGCKKETDVSKGTTTDVSSEENSSEDTPSFDNVDSSDNSTDNSSDSDLDLDISLDDDLGDLGDFEFDFTVTQTVKFDSTAEQKEYAGLMGVFPCYWFLPDKTMEEPYTEEEIEISVKKFLQMGISVVRCLGLGPAYCWDAENDKWDWDSPWISGFYKYCDVMQSNGIDVVVNTPTGITSPKSSLGEENPIYMVAKAQNPELFIQYNEKSVTEEQRAAMMKVYGQWLVDFYNEVVVKRGYTCVKYFEHGTENNNGQDSKTKEEVRKSFDGWKAANVACHDALTAAGIRDKFTFVGPSVVHTSQQGQMENAWTALQWLEWCVEEIDYTIDIYAAHTYGYGTSLSDNLNYNYDHLLDAYEIVKSTGKPFWCDEFNVMTRVGQYLESAAEPIHGTQIVLGYLYQMINGINGTCVWYPVDFKWPNSTVTTPPSWIEGVHQLGMDTSILESVIPRHAYYAYCLLGTAVRSGDTVYEGIATEDGLFTMLLEHKDGTHSIVAVNLSWNDIEINYELFKDLGGKTFTKAVYNPTTNKPTTEYKPIEPTAEINNVGKTFTDKIGAYQVVVYNQK